VIKSTIRRRYTVHPEIAGWSAGFSPLRRLNGGDIEIP